MSGARWAARPATFTVTQYEELEQEALIYKYLVAGVPVPPDLRLPTFASRFYHHHARPAERRGGEGGERAAAIGRRRPATKGKEELNSWMQGRRWRVTHSHGEEQQ